MINNNRINNHKYNDNNKNNNSVNTFVLGKLSNFVTKTDDDTTRNFEYDYESIMHYGPYFFR